MALSVDYLTKIITVPKADLTFISGTLYEMNTNAFRLELHSIQDSAGGIFADDFFVHNTEVTVAGVTYARTIEMVNSWQVRFEDGQYAVRLVGSNNNIFDEGVLVRNQVSVIPTNSSGLQTIDLAQLELLVEQLHRRKGLDPANPLQYTDSTIDAGDISQTITDAAGTTTVQRV